MGSWQNINNLLEPPDFHYASVASGALTATGHTGDSFNIPIGATINSVAVKIYENSSGNSGGVNYITITNSGSTESCNASPNFLLDNDTQTITFNSSTCERFSSIATVPKVNSGHFGWYITNSGTKNASLDAISMQANYTFSPAILNDELTPGSVWEWTSINSAPVKKEGLEDIVSVAIGNNFNLALKNDGTVWAWGQNNHGQLGIGATGTFTSEPVQVKSSNGEGYLTDAKQVAAGNGYGMVLKNDGTVWEWGFNGSNIRGTDIDSDNILVPAKVKNLSQVVSIAAGVNHSLALKSDGTVWGWGINNYGQTGTGYSTTTGVIKFPVRVNIDNVISVSAGNMHSLVAKNDGTVWGWGRLDAGQLGSYLPPDGWQSHVWTPIQVPEISGVKKVWARDYSSMALTENEGVFGWGGGRALPYDVNPRQIEGLRDIKTISVGLSNSLSAVVGEAIDKNGDVWIWDAENSKGLVKLPFFSNIKEISIGGGMPNLAVVAMDGSTPAPFLDLPWDYEAQGLTFNEAAMTINSYFDHEYPLLSTSLTDEPAEAKGTITNFQGKFRVNLDYSKHDGYDYGRNAKVNINDPVLAAASGIATLNDSCKACGKMILIDHGNGYQTRYMHLQKDGLITEVPGQEIHVNAHQEIGLVGSTGNSTGAHIHFGVFKDRNQDGNFADNSPDGATDPFGWQSKESDPWPLYTFLIGETQKTGNKSHYLWIKKLDNLDATLTSNGGVFQTERYKLDFSEEATPQNLNLHLYASPAINIYKTLRSIGSSIDVQALNLLGQPVSNFDKPFVLTVDFSSYDLSAFKTDTIAIYSSIDGKDWIKEDTSLDFVNKTATASISHLTQFALLAERVDTVAPTTTVTLDGLKGQSNWFRSDVILNLSAQDNEGGFGVDYTLYKKDDSDWEEYEAPIVFSAEGHHRVDFYSVDKDDNIEEVKTVEFDIDKTKPQVAIDASPKILWPVNNKMLNVEITGNAFDVNLLNTKIMVNDEYDEVEPLVFDFGQAIQLRASRDGNDFDGRKYTIKAIAEDLAGNVREDEVEVIVPHDQGEESEPSPLDAIISTLSDILSF